MKILLPLLLSLLFHNQLIALPDEPYIIESIIENNQKRDMFEKQWKKENCPKRKDTTHKIFFRCIKDASSKAEEKYPQRGTEDYCKKVYKVMSKEEQTKKLSDLLSIKYKVRGGYLDDVDKGEFDRGMLDVEVLCLRQYLNKIRIYDVDKGEFIQ